jgi:hypothetical protein
MWKNPFLFYGFRVKPFVRWSAAILLQQAENRACEKRYLWLYRGTCKDWIRRRLVAPVKPEPWQFSLGSSPFSAYNAS